MESLPACAKDVQLFCSCGKFIRPRNCWKRQAERSRSDSGATLDQTSEASRCSYAFFSHAKDRKSTRLNSSHVAISYAVFCLKKKKNNKTNIKIDHTQHLRI